MARLGWTSIRDRSAIPDKTGAILGSAFHAVIKDAHFGAFAGENDPRSAARIAFDRDVQARLQTAHPLVQLKFPKAAQLPFYSIRREQCAAIAERAAAAVTRAHIAGARGGQRSVGGSEQWLESCDQLLFGRADYLDRSGRAVIDYKSGFVRPSDEGGASESEQRQLRFYGNLAIENGVGVDRGLIVRGTGSSIELPLTSADCAAEAENARAVLRRYNAAVAGGASFADLATPASSSCAFCDCIPFCDRFWSLAEPAWREACGTHVEGIVHAASSINSMGVHLVQLRLTNARGTVDRSDATLEQVPVSWLEAAGGVVPSVGQRVRATDCRSVEQRPGVLRADKTSTAVWSCIDGGQSDEGAT